MRESIMTELGQGVGVRAHYPSATNFILFAFMMVPFAMSMFASHKLRHNFDKMLAGMV